MIELLAMPNDRVIGIKIDDTTTNNLTSSHLRTQTSIQH